MKNLVYLYVNHPDRYVRYRQTGWYVRSTIYDRYTYDLRLIKSTYRLCPRVLVGRINIQDVVYFYEDPGDLRKIPVCTCTIELLPFPPIFAFCAKNG